MLDAEFAVELAPEKLWNARIAFTMAAVLYALFTLVANLFLLVSAVVICGTGQARRYRYLVENFCWRRTLAEDVATKEQARRQSEHRASHDLLTGLPNRRHFIDLVDRTIEDAGRQGTRGALMFIDLDGFKPINDTYGHAVGDGVLKILAQRMQNCLRAPDAAARLAGDEFGALVALPLGTSDNAASVANKMLKTVSQPIVIGPLRVAVSASFGVALFPCHGTDAETLMSIADRCMYEVKRNGKAGIGVASLDATHC